MSRGVQQPSVWLKQVIGPTAAGPLLVAQSFPLLLGPEPMSGKWEALRSQPLEEAPAIRPWAKLGLAVAAKGRVRAWAWGVGWAEESEAGGFMGVLLVRSPEMSGYRLQRNFGRLEKMQWIWKWWWCEGVWQVKRGTDSDSGEGRSTSSWGVRALFLFSQVNLLHGSLFSCNLIMSCSEVRIVKNLDF